MIGHFKRICRECGKTIAQCRCIGLKPIAYGLCDECKTKRQGDKKHGSKS